MQPDPLHGKKNRKLKQNFYLHLAEEIFCKAKHKNSEVALTRLHLVSKDKDIIAEFC